MTDEEIRAIFDELRRVGADLGRPPGLALGTGFGPGEFLSWLRSLPEALGHDAFAERLRDHVAAAAPLPNDPDAEKAPRPFQLADFLERRSLPSREQLELGVTLLVNEWDPLGARLGTLTPEDVDRYALDVLGGIVMVDGDPRREIMVAERLRELEEREFAVRASPIEQRRYLARRLCAIVDEHPAPPLHVSRAVEPARTKQSTDTGIATAKGTPVERHGAISPGRRVSSYVEVHRGSAEPLPALDPTATCAECGKTGTVAYVTRDIELRLSRYCRDCWPQIRSWAWEMPRFNPDRAVAVIELFERVERKRHEGLRSADSALWEDRFGLMEELLTSHPSDMSVEDRDRTLREWARALVDIAGRMDGPMPPRVEAFVRQHGAFDA